MVDSDVCLTVGDGDVSALLSRGPVDILYEAVLWRKVLTRVERWKEWDNTHSWVTGGEEIPAVEEVVAANVFRTTVHGKSRREA